MVDDGPKHNLRHLPNTIVLSPVIETLTTRVTTLYLGALDRWGGLLFYGGTSRKAPSIAEGAAQLKPTVVVRGTNELP